MRRETHNVAMLITLISLGMLFATFFLGYAVYRSSSQIWPPGNTPPLDLKLPGLNTLVIVLSSLSYLAYQKRGEALWWLATFGLGSGFVFLQFRFWKQLKNAGLFVHTNIFSSIVHGITWVHTAHMLAGLAALVWLAFDPKNALRLTNVGKFWHFLGGTWLIIYLGMVF